MKSGVHVTHLIFEAGEVIKDERCSASCLHTHTHKKNQIKKKNKPTHQTSPVGSKRVSAAFLLVSLPASFPGRTLSDGQAITNGPHNSEPRRTMMLVRASRDG